MVRIISKLLMALALAGFLIPSVTSDADAGRRYKSSGKNHGNTVRRGHRHRGGFLLRIPASHINRRVHKPIDFSNRSYRGGPKVIDVQKTLRARHKRELANQ